jgi:hypothetical protein
MNALSQITTLTLAFALAALAHLTQLYASFAGREISVYQTSFAYFLLGAFVAILLRPQIRYQRNVRSGWILIVAIALVTWGTTRAEFIFLPRGTVSWLLAVGGSLGFLGFLNFVPDRDRVWTVWFGAFVMATLISLATHRGVVHYGYRVATEGCVAGMIIAGTVFAFVYRLRNGWVALAAVMLAAVPVFCDHYFFTIPVSEITHREIHAREVTLLERPDPNFPGIPQHNLYVDGSLRFNSGDDQTYYQCLVTLPMMAGEWNQRPAKNALVIGGGTGVAARNLLSRNHVKNITLIDPDPIFEFSKTELKMRIYSLDALKSPRVETVEDDPTLWLSNNAKSFDLIIIDWPLENRLQSERIFSGEFFSQVEAHLSPDGFLSTNAGRLTKAEIKSNDRSAIVSSLYLALESLHHPVHVIRDSKTDHVFLWSTVDPDFNFVNFAKKSGISGKNPASPCRWLNDEKLRPGITPASLTRSAIAKNLAEPFTAIRQLSQSDRNLLIPNE